MTVTAYQKAQASVNDPRLIEYRLFGEITGALIDAGVSAKPAIIAEAIDRNRRLWSLLAVDCADDHNELPHELRASIISLSIWVRRYSKQVMRKGAPVDPLVVINRNIMQGLQGAA